MDWKALLVAERQFDPSGAPRYEQLASKIGNVIAEQRVASGERLPTVRELSKFLNVSATTVTSAFALLESQKVIRAEVGRGTFVNESFGAHSSGEIDHELVNFRAHLRAPQPNYAWRRRALMSISSRLRATYPDAMECSTGRPDPALLPLRILRKAWEQAMQNVSARDLQYASPEPIAALCAPVKTRLERDGIPFNEGMGLICNSAQQAFALAMELIAGNSTQQQPAVAVEEPGYPTLLDTLERSGFRMVGLQMDEYGVLPAALNAALRAGVQAVFLTPRGQNPTGASWSAERRSRLADVLSAYPQALVLEDDQVAEVASTRPGSLLADPRLQQRVIYVRSLSKAIAPDLRIAIVCAHPSLINRMAEAKSFSDGWTSHLIQRVAALALADDELDAALRKSQLAYAERRRNASEAANRLLIPIGGATWSGTDGVNIWIHLPQGCDSREVVERAAANGVRLADGEPFYLVPGHRNVLRLNAGSVSAKMSSTAGEILGNTATASSTSIGPIHV